MPASFYPFLDRKITSQNIKRNARERGSKHCWLTFFDFSLGNFFFCCHKKWRFYFSLFTVSTLSVGWTAFYFPNYSAGGGQKLQTSVFCAVYKMYLESHSITVGREGRQSRYDDKAARAPTIMQRGRFILAIPTAESAHMGLQTLDHSFSNFFRTDQVSRTNFLSGLGKISARVEESKRKTADCHIHERGLYSYKMLKKRVFSWKVRRFKSGGFYTEKQLDTRA